MSLNAILFDVDGTLIDTNPAHIEAWIRALGSFNYHIAPDRISGEMGKGGDKFIPSILGQEIYQRQGKELAHAHTAEFKKIAASTRLKVFPGVKELIEELKRRGLKTVLATSSKMEELETTQRSAGIDLREWVDEVVTADDAAQSKPAPDLVHAAVKKLGMFPAQCAMFGDTPYDIDACRDAGVVCFGLLCGGLNSEQTLRHVGARAVYIDPADVLRQLDAVLSAASPAAIPLTHKLSLDLMREALATAQRRDGRGRSVDRLRAGPRGRDDHRPGI